MGRWTKVDKKVLGLISEEEEIEAKSKFKLPGEIHFPIQDTESGGKRSKVRVTEKLQAVGKNILRRIKKMPKGVVDKFIHGELSERDKIIEEPLEFKDTSIRLYHSTKEKEVSWILTSRRGVNRKRILVPLSKESGKDGFVIDYVTGRQWHDISLLPTIISAALRGQVNRFPPKIKLEDLKFKKKMAYSKLVIIIVMDTSSSMNYLIGGLSKALLDFKFSAWRKRDKVGLIVCSGKESEVLFPPTNNLNIIKRNLIKIKFGGSTPLADGMIKALTLLKLEKMKDPDILPLVLIISDGLANEPLKAKIPDEIYDTCPIIGAADVIYVAYKYRRLRIPTIIINPIHKPDDDIYFGWNPTKILEFVARVTKGIYIGLTKRKDGDYAEKMFKLIFSAINTILRRKMSV